MTDFLVPYGAERGKSIKAARYSTILWLTKVALEQDDAILLQALRREHDRRLIQEYSVDDGEKWDKMRREV